MAIVYSIPKILKKSYANSYIEENLLVDFLDRNLSDDYEVYHRPQLNGDRPPIIIMRKGYGVLIINLFNESILKYSISRETWTYNNNTFNSPFDQAKLYKRNIYNLHSNILSELVISNSAYYSIIQTMVYFPYELTGNIHLVVADAIKKGFPESENNSNDKSKYEANNYLEKKKFFGQDVVESNYIEAITKKGVLATPRKIFNDELYDSFRRYFIPSFHSKDQGQHLGYSKKQKTLVESFPEEKKIRGVVGSGKTFVLAKRAVNAHKRTGKDVLILTFNITLRNYIKEAIGRVKEDFYWDNFFINNYHHFFNQQSMRAGLRIPSLPSYENKNHFENTRTLTQRFDTILIDEVQDYKKEWILIIRKYFLKEGGEIVFFGDEKQNIYNRTLETDKRPYTGLGGRWNQLSESFRSKNSIIRLTENFQEEFLLKKYDIEKISQGNQTQIFELSEHLEHHYISNTNNTQNLREIISYINDKIQLYQIHPEDIVIIGLQRNLLRQLDILWRLSTNEKTSVTFDNHEAYYLSIIKLLDSNEEVRKLINLFRFNKENLVTAIGYYLSSAVFNDEKLNNYLNKLNIKLDEFNEAYDLFQALHADKVTDPMGVIANNRIFSKEERDNKRYFTNKLNNSLYNLQRNRKIHFQHNGLTKLSTIHSYKGWESHTVFLMIEDSKNGSSSLVTPEIIYTGLSRAMVNLFVISSDVTEYSDFFDQNMNT